MNKAEKERLDRVRSKRSRCRVCRKLVKATSVTPVGRSVRWFGVCACGQERTGLYSWKTVPDASEREFNALSKKYPQEREELLVRGTYGLRKWMADLFEGAAVPPLLRRRLAEIEDRDLPYFRDRMAKMRLMADAKRAAYGVLENALDDLEKIC